MLTLLRVQADQKAQSAGISSGATAVDGLIPELELERVFGIKPGTLFSP